MIKLAGGIPKFIQIKPPTDPSKANTTANWAIDMEELDSMFTSKTKLVIINNPNNPLGKVFTLPELTAVADIIKKHDVMCISDEVYEHLIYPGVEMHRMATFEVEHHFIEYGTDALLFVKQALSQACRCA